MNKILAASLRIKIAKWLDEYVGRVLIALVHRLRLGWHRVNAQTERSRILVIKFWGMGSIILLEPALRRLRERFPYARIDFLTLTQNRELFALLPQVDHVHVLDFHRSVRFMLHALTMLVRMRQQRYDLIFDAEFFANFSALLARFAAPKKLLGFSRPHGYKRSLLDIAVPFHDDEHAAHNFLRLISAEAQAKPNEAKVCKANLLFPRINLNQRVFENSAAPCVVMNLNASPLALERRWPRENFVQLAHWLLRQYEVELALIGSREERTYTQQAADMIAQPARVKNLAGELRVRELAELIHASALFISNDSGPLHLAAALQKPVVGFYGPETPQRFGPLCERRLLFYLNLPCSPCMSVDNAKTVNCTNHLRCMRELRVRDVVPELQRFIKQHALLSQRVTQSKELTSLVGASPYAA